MSRANVEVAERLYAARNRGDVEGVLAECTPEVEWRPHLATLGGEPIRGHDAVRDYMASLRQDWEIFRHEPERFIDAGDDVVVAFLYTRAQGRDGIDVDVPVAHVLRFSDGKCLGYESYHDRGEALRAAGLPPQD